MSAPAIIQSLVNRFRDSRELYRSGRYNEAQLRQEFLNPFFEALGWDMFNRSNFAPQYREVIHEDSLEDEGSLKAPDYAFRIGTTRKFFVEAKKPAVDIRYAIHPAYQLRRYAWNAHLPLSILTDFEELAVYDCRTRPDPKDSAATGRVMLFTFEEYVERWDELAQIFSRDAVWNGSFDRYAEGTKGKRGTTEVDAEFLKEIEQWRLLLARNIALRNFRPSAGSVIGSEAPSVIASEARQSPSVNPSEARSIIANEATRSVQSTQSTSLHRAERQLNYAVQTTIDRILFLRICEDRQIEPADQLLQLAEGSDVYAHLLLLFQKADQKYNSGLFHFSKEKGQTSEPDTFTPTLQIDDKVLRQIIKSTYFPCPYMFNEIPVEILGQVYEQFLGSVIRLTPAGQAKVEEKPEVRKAGGVYYTPRYIVDYIVQNTLGRLLGQSGDGSSLALPEGRVREAGVRDTSINEDGLETSRSEPVHGEDAGTIGMQSPSVIASEAKQSQAQSEANGGEGNITPQSLTPTQALNLRVVDPACGSGSFLLGAYQYLLDWHLNYYLNHDPQSHTRGKNPPLVATEGGEYRLTTETKKRILTASIYGVDIDSQAVEVTKLSLLLKLLEGETGQLSLGFERVLPDLDQNIRCGNSLIGWDYFKGQMFPDEEEIQRVNPFDWQRAFPHVFAAGGFDAVIGNPPYARIDPKISTDYINSHYPNHASQVDMYLLFLERYETMLADDGLLGVIVSNTWLQSVTFQKIRRYLTNNYVWKKILHLPDKVFKAVIDTHVLIFQRSKPNLSTNHQVVIDFLKNGIIQEHHQLRMNNIKNDGSSINIVLKATEQDLIDRIFNKSKPLCDDFTVYNGVKPFEVGKGHPPQTKATVKNHIYVKEGEKPDHSWKPLLRGSLIQRYQTLWNNNYWILYGKWLAAPRDPSIFSAPRKIVVRQTGDSIISTIIDDSFICRDNLHVILPKSNKYSLEFLLGLLNSKLMDYCYSYLNPEKGEALAQVKKKHVESLPIIEFDVSDTKNKLLYETIVDNVNYLLTLNRNVPLTPMEAENLQRAITTAESTIDDLVYELYGLSDEEIKIIEEKTL